jgi:hypothetical protein
MQILVASNNFDYDKKDCLLAIDPVARTVSDKYCSPGTGVHYAVGVVNKKYVVGYTGLSKDISNFRIEGGRPVSSSFSVWRAEMAEVAAVAKDPTDHGAQLNWRVTASSAEPVFIAFPRTPNLLYLYSIMDPD